MRPDLLKELKDIKPPVEVPDQSLWLLLGAVAAVLLAAEVAWWALSRRPRRRRRRKKSPREVAKERLAALEYADTKGAVYAFGEYLPTLLEGDEEAMRDFEALWERLARYRYKKEVPPLAKEDIKAMKALVKRGLRHG
ncbi:hypothetical protein [Hydrogenimonas sp.]